MKVKEESEKVGLKLNIQKTKITASGPITSWQIDGETVETAADFLLGGSKVTADGDCSHEIKRHLLLGRNAMTNIDSILKSRDITLSTKVCLVKAMVFPMVMYGYESWTIKKAECQRIDGFAVWCWRRQESGESLGLQGDPTSPFERKSVLGVHWKDWCWSRNSKILATWCEELTHRKRLWCWKRLKSGGEGDHRGWDGWMASLTRWTGVWVSSGSGWWTGRPGVLQSMGWQRISHDSATGLDWTGLLLTWEALPVNPLGVFFASNSCSSLSSSSAYATRDISSFLVYVIHFCSIYNTGYWFRTAEPNCLNFIVLKP